MRLMIIVWAVACAASAALAVDKAESAFMQGLRDFNRARYGQAINSFRQAARMEPKSDILAVHLGVTYANLRRYDEAVQEFRRAISLNPENVLAYFLLEGAYAEKGMRSEAQAAYQSAKRLFSKVDGIVFHSERDINSLKRLVERYPEDAIAENLVGDACQLQEMMEEAITHYHRAAALAPRWVKPHFNLGMACLGRDNGRAIEAFQTVLQLDPGNLKANLWLGDAYSYSNMRDKALSAYGQVGERAPDMPEVSQRVGKVYLESRRYREAEQAFTRATQQAPRDPYNRAGLAEAYAAQGKLDEAIQQYSMALQGADVERSRAVLVMSYVGLAVAYEAKGQPSEALKTLEKAAFLDRAHTATYLREAGKITERQGRESQAAACWRGSLEADPEGDDFATARLLRQKGLLPRFVSDYERAVKRNPNNLPALLALSGLYRFQGNLSQALALTERIVAVSPGRTESWITLGQLHERLGNPTRAAAAYRRALGNQPRIPRLRSMLKRVEEQGR
ncbi:MAG: tetratricopeptide repeat protein [Armatimonadetes bacterium]|nr:tetratricopeptide repeat protein [Armatimonadota bacterium]